MISICVNDPAAMEVKHTLSDSNVMTSNNTTHITEPATNVAAIIVGCSFGVVVMWLVLLISLIALCSHGCTCCTRRQRRKKDIMDEQPTTRGSVHEYMELTSGDHYDQVDLPHPCPALGADDYLVAAPSSGCSQYTKDNLDADDETDMTNVSTPNSNVSIEIKDGQNKKTINIRFP